MHSKTYNIYPPISTVNLLHILNATFFNNLRIKNRKRCFITSNENLGILNALYAIFDDKM